MGSSRKLFFGALSGAIVNTFIVIGNALLIASLAISVIDGGERTARYLALLGGLWIFKAIFQSLFDRWSSLRASELKSELRSSILHSSSILERTPSTHLTTLLIKGGNSLDIYCARFLPQLFAASITPITVIAIIALNDPLSALIAVLTLPLIPLFGALIGKYTEDAVAEKWSSLGTLGKYFEDSLRGIHTLAIFSRLKSQSRRIEEMGDRYTDETMKVLRISFLSALVLELAATISVALIAVSIGVRLVSGSMDFWPALLILVLAPEVYFPLRNAASLFHASADGTAALSELTSIQSENSVPAQGGDSLGDIEEISWSRWSSPFGGSEIPPSHLKSGEVLVLRGGSGQGKTTFLKSILGYGESDHLTINGRQAATFSLESRRSRIGWIPQNPSLISGTLRELFQFLDPLVSETEIERALSRVGLEVKALPSGIDTDIGGSHEKSGHLSGGQIRRIAIARALFINPSLLIADEPTADLDHNSAQEILTLIHDLASEGVIVIAVLHSPDHRISGSREMEIASR